MVTRANQHALISFLSIQKMKKSRGSIYTFLLWQPILKYKTLRKGSTLSPYRLEGIGLVNLFLSGYWAT